MRGKEPYRESFIPLDKFRSKDKKETNHEILMRLSGGKKSDWTKDAKYRIKNRKWLTYSSKIAIRILSAIEDIEGMTKEKLAIEMKMKPKKLQKVLSGHKNLSLKMISKFSEVLKKELIEFPVYKYMPPMSKIDGNSNIEEQRTMTNDWISVEDNLPQMQEDDVTCSDYVLAYSSKFGNGTSGYIIIAWLDDKGNWNMETEYGFTENYDNNPDYFCITHWQLLPRSPIQ